MTLAVAALERELVRLADTEFRASVVMAGGEKANSAPVIHHEAQAGAKHEAGEEHKPADGITFEKEAATAATAKADLADAKVTQADEETTDTELAQNGEEVV